MNFFCTAFNYKIYLISYITNHILCWLMSCTHKARETKNYSFSLSPPQSYTSEKSMFVNSRHYFVLHRVTNKALNFHCVEVLMAVKFNIHISSADSLSTYMLHVDTSSLLLACSRTVFFKYFLLH